MSEKTFRPWEIDQTWLFPPSVRDFVPEGHVALDGTKMRANASKHAAMSCARLKKAEPELAELAALVALVALVEAWLENSRSADDEHGEDHRGDELPQRAPERALRPRFEPPSPAVIAR